MVGFPVHIGEGQELVLNSLALLLGGLSVVSYEGPVLVVVTHELVIFIEVACKERWSGGEDWQDLNSPIELFRRSMLAAHSSLCNN